MEKNLFDVELGKVLKEIREEKKLSLRDVGERLNISRQSVNHYESGRVPLTVIQLKKICSIYGVNYGDVLNQADYNLMNKSV